MNASDVHELPQTEPNHADHSNVALHTTMRTSTLQRHFLSFIDFFLLDHLKLA